MQKSVKSLGLLIESDHMKINRFLKEKKLKEQIILASASPRRRELLMQAGIEFICKPSDVEEVITKSAPQDVVEELSRQKALDIAKNEKNDCMVIGSDTVVACDGQILGKPKDEPMAEEMLQKLQGKCHHVYTGVTIVKKQDGSMTQTTFYEDTKVWVYPMTKEEILAYVKTGEPMDKAGGYGIQTSFGLKYIQKIEGDYYNVVGLPVSRLYQELKIFLKI